MTDTEIILVCLQVVFCVIIYTIYRLQRRMTEQHEEFEKKFDKAVETLMKEIKGINNTSSNDDHDTPTKLNKK